MLAIAMDLVPSNELQVQCNQSFKSITVLIIDDNDDNLLLLSYALEELRYSTIQGASGRDAINLAISHEPDLILLDILLPDISGMAVIKQLRQQPTLKNKPIIAVTALAHPIDRSKIIAAGFTDYISKPYMLDELYTLISQYIS